MNNIYFTALVRKDQLDNFKVILDGLPVGQSQPEAILPDAHLYYLTGSLDIMELLASTGIRCAERTPSDPELYLTYLESAFNEFLTTS